MDDPQLGTNGEETLLGRAGELAALTMQVQGDEELAEDRAVRPQDPSLVPKVHLFTRLANHLGDPMVLLACISASQA